MRSALLMNDLNEDEMQSLKHEFEQRQKAAEASAQQRISELERQLKALRDQEHKGIDFLEEVSRLNESRPFAVKVGLATSKAVEATNATLRVTFDTQVDRSAGDEIVLLKASSGMNADPLATEMLPEVVPRASMSTKAGVLTLVLNPNVSPDVLFRTPYTPIAPGKYVLAYDRLSSNPHHGPAGPAVPHGHKRIQGPELELLPSRPTQPGRALLTWLANGLQVSWRAPLFDGGAEDGKLVYQVSAKLASAKSDEEVFALEPISGKTEVVVSQKTLEKCPSTEGGKLGCVFQVRAKNPSVDEWSTGGWWSDVISLK